MNHQNNSTNTEKVNTLGGRLKLLRKKAGLTQAAVAEEFNISETVLSRYENNLVEPPVWFLSTICGFYGVSMDYAANGDIDDNHNIIELTGIPTVEAEALKTLANGLRNGC